MKNFHIIFILFFFLLFSNSFSKEFQNNLQILDSFALIQAQEITKYIQNANDTIYLKILPESHNWLIKEKILSLNKSKVFFQTNDSNLKNINILEIQINEFSASFINYSNSDSVIRQLKSELITNIKFKNGKIENIEVPKFSFNDTLSINEAESANNNLHEATNPQLPKPSKTFLREISEPLILIAVSVISIALLFTVRSK